MRKLALGLYVALFCVSFTGTLMAYDGENENLNLRIKSLQERLKEFKNRTYADDEEKMIVEEEAVDLILDRASESILPTPEMPISDETAERIVEELENRSDVAMTVLFHEEKDNDSGFYGANKNFALIEPPKVIVEEAEPSSRQDFYRSLRTKVLTATRSSKLDNVLAGNY